MCDRLLEDTTAAMRANFVMCRWFNKDVDKCFVATKDTADRATSMGLDDRQIVVHGLPIRPAFSKKPASRPNLRSKLGAPQPSPILLFTTANICTVPMLRV